MTSTGTAAPRARDRQFAVWLERLFTARLARKNRAVVHRAEQFHGDVDLGRVMETAWA
jgi:hypothetical protein